jgi:hypothetical protein
MKKLLRRRWVIGALLLLVVVGAGYLLVPVGEGRISQATCEKIRLGWTREQVTELLRSANYVVPIVYGDNPVGVAWLDEDNNRIEVYFESQPGTRSLEVTRKNFVPSKLSLFERIQLRFQRRIHALWP